MIRNTAKLFLWAGVAMVIAVSAPVAAQAQKTSTTIQTMQQGQININQTSQRGDSNTNTTSQQGTVNINRTTQLGGNTGNLISPVGNLIPPGKMLDNGFQGAGIDRSGSTYNPIGSGPAPRRGASK